MSATTLDPSVAMPIRVGSSLLPELERFGAVEVGACFNCGTCTAVCPMSDGGFPRRVIRLAQLGRREELLSTPELWSCYGCGECTVTCPRQADPAGLMAAARRFAIASYDRTGVARRLATSARFAGVFVSLLVALLAAFLYASHRPTASTRLAPFEFLPVHVVHDLGIAVFVIFGVATVAGLAQMVRRVFAGDTTGDGRPSVARAVWEAVGRESLGQSRFRAECADEPERDPEPRPWWVRRWFVHAATMWGFLGLLAATLVDYALELTGVRRTGTSVPIWSPVRLLGTVAGLLLVYGTSTMIVERLRGRSSVRAAVSDWTFLWMLWLAGVTGFALEVALYLPRDSAWGYGMLLVHVAVAMALVLLAPFGAFAHAIYRPVGLVAVRLGKGRGWIR